ncbi:TPA: hypothetical protein ACIRKI_001756, partial [Streptococcus suis]
ECKTRTNLPINHCAEMLTLTLRSGAGLFAQPISFCLDEIVCVFLTTVNILIIVEILCIFCYTESNYRVKRKI